MTEFYLKILSGNHMGAEIPLEAGRYSLGRDENCDLVLTDASISEIELILEISDDGLLYIQTSTADEPLYLNGQPIGSSLRCNHFDIITSSRLFFTLGPVDAQWPEIILPDLQIPAPAVEAETPTDALDEEHNNEFPDPNAESPETDSDNVNNDLEAVMDSLEDEEEYEYDEESDEYDEEEDEENDYQSPFRQINKKALIAIPAILISLLLILLLIMGDTKEEPPLKLSFLEQASKARNELGLRNISFKELPDKSLTVMGYTSTSRQKGELQKLLRKRNIPFNSQIVAMNELRGNAKDLLKRWGYNDLQLEQDNTPGSLVLTGYISTTDELDNLITTLKQEIHGLVAIVDQVENQSSRINTLKSMIRERNLSTRVHLSIRPGKVTIKGHLLDESQAYQLQELAQRFTDRYGNNPKLILSTRSEGDTLPSEGTTPGSSSNGRVLLPALSIRGISMGRVPYVVMEDGSKYLVGAKLASGYIIEDINLEYLLLTNGTDRIKYRLGGNRDGQP
ncbi:EscD/YscD/HrpQ family type III secretion system inner membrane ring protein [Endozoicomonas sp. (ex Bugula neritina AB1)]|nr:EscD/YscD/HrpQ family type III secretion system inner membrane ring protein [Endozoicomonas sp. (ex Bugula neritina AB1)]